MAAYDCASTGCAPAVYRFIMICSSYVGGRKYHVEIRAAVNCSAVGSNLLHRIAHDKCRSKARFGDSWKRLFSRLTSEEKNPESTPPLFVLFCCQ